MEHPGMPGNKENQRPSMEIGFSEALYRAKKGALIARKGWDGKNMNVYVVKGSHDFCNCDNGGDFIRDIHKNLFEKGDKDSVTRNPRLDMLAADGTIITGWVASQTDLLSEDWLIVGVQEGF